MKENLREISFSEIKSLNGGSRWKADKIVEYYQKNEGLIKVLCKSDLPGEKNFIVNGLVKTDLIFRSYDFDQPIGKRELVVWGLASISVIINVITLLL